MSGTRDVATGEPAGGPATPPAGLLGTDVFRAFLDHQVIHARRQGYPLALMLLTARHGPRETVGPGQDPLAFLSERMRRSARSGDVVGDLGRGHAAWLLPFSDAEGGRIAADRLTNEITAFPGRPRIACGIADLAGTRDAAGLIANALAAVRTAEGRPGDAVVVHETLESTGPPDVSTLDHARAIGNVYAMSRAVDAKDPTMAEHSRRVADLAGSLADRLGWPRARVTRLREAGLLHDVGKLAIPDEILLKAGPLTADEIQIARKHAAIGARVIEGVLDDEQVHWVRHHQERLDGTGYPDGLRGHMIPDGARILCVADSWDVMVSGRPYRRPLPGEAVIAECRVLAGTQFCPIVVGALVELWNEVADADGIRDLRANG